jgi:hypothetical protein
LADDIWSTGDEFVVCEEQPEFDDSSGAVEVCVSHSDPASSSLQLLAAVYSVNCEIEKEKGVYAIKFHERALTLLDGL